MQAVNVIIAGIAKPPTPRGRHDNNDRTLSHLQRRNLRKLKNILFKRQY